MTATRAAAGRPSRLLVGTDKGLFRIRVGADGGVAQVDGPHLAATWTRTSRG